jgi:hypothetical protein
MHTEIDTVLAKYDASGAHLWSHSISYDEDAELAVAPSDDRLYVPSSRALNGYTSDGGPLAAIPIPTAPEHTAGDGSGAVYLAGTLSVTTPWDFGFGPLPTGFGFYLTRIEPP